MFNTTRRNFTAADVMSANFNVVSIYKLAMEVEGDNLDYRAFS
jgi:VIT1/CCC1 family predicted Fe2+/Mn2+ transporter